LRRNWSAKIRSLLFEQGENDVSDRDAALSFSRVLDRAGSAVISAKNRLRDTWQAKKVRAMDKLSRHRRDDDIRTGG
jgi:hypothetical protein